MVEPATVPSTFGTAMMKFFGKLPEQPLGGFLQELRDLTDKDRAEFTIMLEQRGYKIVKP